MHIEKAIIALHNDIKKLKDGIVSVNELILEKEKMIDNLKEQLLIVDKD